MGQITANANKASDHFKTIGDIVSSRHCPSFFKDDYIKIILPVLQDSDIGAAGVMDDDGRLAGLLTERSILQHMFVRSTDKTIHRANVAKYLDDMTVEDVMIKRPETLDDDISIEDAAGMMIRRGFRFMPVVSRFDRSRMLGIVGERELAVYLQQRLKDVKKSEVEYRSMLAYMLREPYGAGFGASNN